MYEFIQVGNTWKVVWGPIPAELKAPAVPVREVELRREVAEARLDRYVRDFGSESLFTMSA